MAIIIPGDSLEIDTSLQTLFPLNSQVSGLIRGIVDEEAGDLLECPNCGELYSTEVGCLNCGYKGEVDIFRFKEQYLSDFEIDNRTIEYNFSHGLFTTSEIEINDGEIKEVKFKYLKENYKVLISGTFPGFRISIYKEVGGDPKYYYAPRFHFDQIRNFIHVLLKDYKEKQN